MQWRMSKGERVPTHDQVEAKLGRVECDDTHATTPTSGLGDGQEDPGSDSWWHPNPTIDYMSARASLVRWALRKGKLIPTCLITEDFLEYIKRVDEVLYTHLCHHDQKSVPVSPLKKGQARPVSPHHEERMRGRMKLVDDLKNVRRERVRHSGGGIGRR